MNKSFQNPVMNTYLDTLLNGYSGNSNNGPVKTVISETVDARDRRDARIMLGYGFGSIVGTTVAAPYYAFTTMAATGAFYASTGSVLATSVGMAGGLVAGAAAGVFAGVLFGGLAGIALVTISEDYRAYGSVKGMFLNRIAHGKRNPPTTAISDSRSNHL